MNHNLFRHLMENRVITTGVEIAIHHELFENLKATGYIRGTFKLVKAYAHPLLPDTRLVVSDGTTTLDINKNDIKLVGGKLPSVWGEETGYVPMEMPDGYVPPKLNSEGKQRRIRLHDSLDEFTAEDYTADNYVEEKVDPEQFLTTTHVTYG